MANGTHSSQRAKDEENNNGRLRRIGEKEKINSRPNVSDATGLRRSPRETSSKKVIPSPSSTRKSERLEKRTLPSPAVKRKSERVEKQMMPSSLRRSGRTKNHSSLSPSDSKSSGSSSSKQKPKKERSVKQLTFEAKEVNENEEHDLGTSQVEIKRMDARTYRSIFKKPKEDLLEEPNRIDKSTQEGGNNGGGKIDECSKGSHLDCKEVSRDGTLLSEDANTKEMRADSRLSGPVKGLLENNVILGSLLPSNTTTYETNVAPQTVQPDCCGEETLQMLVSRNSVLDEKLVRNSVGHDRGEKLVPSKRKGTMVDVDSDVSATLANDDNCNLIADAGPSRLGGNIVGTGRSCSKQRRLDSDPTVACYNKSYNPSATELQDGGDIDASMLLKECPANLLTDVAKNICLICKSKGQLLFCGGKGCNGCYHLSCLEPSLVDAPTGVWHCHFCVRKKIELGVYSVSEGVESVCDAKEVPFSSVDGLTAQKEFLVKYKGLAHVHNRWVPENQLLLEAPSLLMKFNQKDQTLMLKPEWSLPHRLLQKRALTHVEQHDDQSVNHAVDNFDCCYEWLVKWRGLGYEHTTWELDSASFLRSPEGQSLIRGYEERFQRAKRVSSCSKLDKKADQGSSVNKLSQMPGGVSSGFGNNNFLDAVNKLREHWHKGQNALVIDDYERILKVVAFILSLHSDTYRPFLIISTAASLHSWEDEFYQLDPSIDVVIYSGNKEMRSSIRRLEFYDEGGCILFQVLIVVPEILIEDIDVLGGIEWEAIIVDECQSPKISSYFKQIKMLNTHLRVLLFRGQLKDSIEENMNILALLDCQSDNEKENGLISNSSNSIVQLKDRLSSHIAYECKSDSFRFVEYWVPVQISHVQLEQYCATLLSNASILRSSSKTDTVGALRDVLISTWKCCKHPYFVDPSLKALLTEGLQAVEYLDVEIKASGKLQLLDSMLMELRKKKLRGLVLFQSIGGSGRCSIGDLLDDFVRYRFGEDSYERIDKGLLSSKKQAAMKKFNNKDNGRFVFLLETCACLPSIKLSSVDAVIIFDSDWNPMNDIRSLQKITLDSQFELIKIFRLYSSFTVEEKALILAKQDKTPDINLQNMSPSTSHMLLMWGASCLFDDLRVFDDGETSVSNLKSLFEQPLLKEAVHEFLSILSQDGEDNDTNNCSILLKVQQNGVTYRSKSFLLGELKLRLLDEEPPYTFWTKLLEGKQFRWKYSHTSSQRSRKRVHRFDGSVDRPDIVSEGIAKKRRKVSNNVFDQPSSKSEGEKLHTRIKSGTAGDPVDGPRGNDVESEKKCRLHDEQKSLHLLLKPEITKLCEVLLFPDNVKTMVDNFLEYIMNNHHVNREPVAILQAFQISLSWTAAALLKHKLDHKASLIRAKQFLNFDCKKEEVEYIYSMLRCLKKIFLYRTGNYNDTGSPKASESSNRVYSYTEVAREVEFFKIDMSKSIKEIKKKCEKHMRKLHLLHQDEKQRLKAAIEDEKADFERRYKIELAVIRCCSPNDVMRTEKLKVLNSEYDKRIKELKCQHETRLKVLEDTQLAEMLKFQDREAAWVEDLKYWAKNELLNIVASKELGTGVENMQTCDQVQPHNIPKNVDLVSDHFDDGKGHGNMVEAMTGTVNGVTETNSTAVVLCSRPVELQTPLVKHIGATEMGIMASEDQSISRSDGQNIAENQNDSEGNIISKHSHSREQNTDGTTSMTNEGDGCENFSRGSRDGCGDDILPSSNGEICHGETSDAPSGEMALEVCKTSSSNDGQDEVQSSTQRKLDWTMSNISGCGFSLEVKANGFSNGTENAASLNSQSPEKHIPSVIAMCMPDCENAARIHEADDCNGSDNAVTEKSPLSVERIADGAIVSVLDREAPMGMPGTVDVTDCPENVTALNSPLSMEQISDGGAVNEVLDRELSRPCGSASPSNGPDTITLLNPPLGHQNLDGVSSSIPDGQIPSRVPETRHEGDTVSVLEREVPVETHRMVNFTDCPGNATPVNLPSSMDRISDGGSINVPVLNSVLSSRPCGAASPSDGLVTNSLLNPPLEQQIPDGVSFSIPDGDIPVIVPENSHAVADCHNDIEPLTNAMLVEKSTTSDQQEGVPRTMTECTLSQETPVSRSVDVMEPLEQMQQLSSVEAPPDQDTAGEMQNSSEQVELVSFPVDVILTNQSNHVSLIVKPSEQVQQLPSAELPSSNQDPSNIHLATGVEHQPIDEDDLPSHDTEASTVVPNQDVVQPDSNSELDSHSHQVVVHPASNSDLDSLTPGGVRTQSSDTRNLSTTSEINNHPIQTAVHSASRMLLPLCSDPLKNELERIQQVTEQIKKNHEDMKLRLKSDFEKEFEELCRKYDIKFQEIEVEFQQTKKNLDTSLNTVLVNKILADAFRSKCMDHKGSGALGMQQDASFAQQLFQLSRQQGATWPSLVAGPSSCVPPAASLQSPSTTASSQNTVAPIQAGYNTSGIFSSVSLRLPPANSISSPSGSLQAGGEIRALAPHNPLYRPSTSVPASSLPALSHGMPSQPAPSNIPATSPAFSHSPARPKPTTYQSDPHMGRRPDSAGGLPTPNLPAMDSSVNANSQSAINLPNVLSRMSDVASLNLSRFGTSSSMLAISSHQAISPDLVCLSDDD